MLAHLRTITFCHESRELPRRIELRKQGRKQSNAMISCEKAIKISMNFRVKLKQHDLNVNKLQITENYTRKNIENLLGLSTCLKNGIACTGNLIIG